MLCHTSFSEACGGMTYPCGPGVLSPLYALCMYSSVDEKKSDLKRGALRYSLAVQGRGLSGMHNVCTYLSLGGAAPKKGHCVCIARRLLMNTYLHPMRERGREITLPTSSYDKKLI